MNVRVGIAILLLLSIGGYFFKKEEPSDETRVVRARLSDVQGLPIGAPITVAGLEVGSIVERRIGAGYSEIDILFQKEVSLRIDATLYKKRNSLLSGPSLEVDPGTSPTRLTDKYIPRVIETSPIGDVLYDISEALPAMTQKADQAQRRIEDLQAKLNGPITDAFAQIDLDTQDLHSRMKSRLTGMNEALAVSEVMQFDVKGAVTPGIERSEELAHLAQGSLERARSWVNRSAAEARRQVDETDFDWDPYAAPIRSIDEGEGQLGVLLNDDTLYDDVVDLSKTTKQAIRSYVSWQMRVGLRGELAVSGQSRAYITLKAGRTNRYFYMELVSSSQGGAPTTTIQYDPDVGTWRRALTVENKLRFTAQWAGRIGPAVLRYGIKESSFGAGMDLQLFDKSLEISADVFEFGQAEYPHLKLAVAYELFGNLYILAGLDDALNKSYQYNLTPAPETPNIFEEISLGRDYFFGASLRFSDKDLASLMRIGGGALSGLGN